MLVTRQLVWPNTAFISTLLLFLHPAAVSNMPSHLLEKMGRMRRWRQYTPYFHLQSARHYTPSSHHQAFTRSRKSTRSRYVLPPMVPPEKRPEPLKRYRAYQTDGSRQTGSKSRWQDWAKNHKYIVRGLVVLGSGTIIFYCFLSQSVPITRRRRLDYVPDWITESIEKIHQGNDEHIETLTSLSWGSENPKMQGPISVFNRLIQASGLDDREWEFRIVNAPSVVNAVFIKSSGLVLVFSGFFTHAVKSEDELAAVLAHEIAHVLANHERESKSMLAIAGIVTLPLGLLRRLMPEALSIEGPNRTIVSLLTYLRRRQEMEADFLGMMLMADAGFNPSATTGMWKKMREMKDLALSADPRVQQIPQWMSSHPDDALRISYTEKWIPEILEILGKPASDGVPVRSSKLKAKKRRWNNFVKQRDEGRS